MIHSGKTLSLALMSFDVAPGQDLYTRRQAAGAHRITGDLAAIAAHVPALFESLSGMQIQDKVA